MKRFLALAIVALLTLGPIFPALADTPYLTASGTVGAANALVKVSGLGGSGYQYCIVSAPAGNLNASLQFTVFDGAGQQYADPLAPASTVAYTGALTTWVLRVPTVSNAFQVQAIAYTSGSETISIVCRPNPIAADYAVGGSSAPSLLLQSAASQYATRHALSSGTYTFTYPAAYTSTPICLVSEEGSTVNVLKAVPGTSSCVITSSAGGDSGTVDIVVIGNPN